LFVFYSTSSFSLSYPHFALKLKCTPENSRIDNPQFYCYTVANLIQNALTETSSF
jgi:hypothetical protein